MTDSNSSSGLRAPEDGQHTHELPLRLKWQDEHWTCPQPGKQFAKEAGALLRTRQGNRSSFGHGAGGGCPVQREVDVQKRFSNSGRGNEEAIILTDLCH